MVENLIYVGLIAAYELGKGLAVGPGSLLTQQYQLPIGKLFWQHRLLPQ
jgi:hypothetical protein